MIDLSDTATYCVLLKDYGQNAEEVTEHIKEDEPALPHSPQTRYLMLSRGATYEAAEELCRSLLARGAEAETCAEFGDFGVRLGGFTNKLAAIRVVAKHTSCGIGEGKKRVEAGGIVAVGLSERLAKACAEELCATGATASLVSGAPLPPIEHRTRIRYNPCARNHAMLYYDGRVLIEQGKIEEGIPMLRKAAEHSNGDAQSYLAKCYEEGVGVPKNDAEALKWYKRAAEQQNAEGLYHLALRYRDGNGVPKDEKEAFYLMRVAANLALPDASNALGVFYATGVGTEIDMKKAVSRFREAQGHPKAQFNLALCYLHGEGVEEDREKAIELLQVAAEQGHEEAREMYARLTKK